jgi:predicted dehydrogenase
MRSGSRVLVGFQFRFHPGLQQAARLLGEAAIGRPLSVRVHWGEYLPSWHPWEDYRSSYSAQAELGGGVILTLSHPFDYLRWLFGEVSSLWAFAGRLNDLDLDVEDTAEVGLQFSNGVIGSLHLDYNQQPPAHKLEVVGTKGSLFWDNADGGLKYYSEPVRQAAEGGSGKWESVTPQPGFERNELFLAEMRHFLALVRGETQPACTLDDGVQALKLALAARQSGRQGRLVRLKG